MKSFHSHTIRQSLPWQNQWVPQSLSTDDSNVMAYDHSGAFLAVGMGSGVLELWDTRFVPVAMEMLQVRVYLPEAGRVRRTF